MVGGRPVTTALLGVFFCGVFFQETGALQCFVCTANRFLNKDCRSLAAARLIDCPDTSTHCNAIVTDIDGTITVNRGCSGNVDSWGFGADECDIMANEKIIDRAVAFYQCRGDGCNNIEPGQITTIDKVATGGVKSKVPQFSMSSQLSSEHTMSRDNLVEGSRAIVSEQDADQTRRGKQLQDNSDDDDSYGLPNKERRTRPRTTPTTTTPTTTTTTATTTSTTRWTPPSTRTTTATTTTPTTTTTTVTAAPKIWTNPPLITRPRRARNFTVFD